MGPSKKQQAEYRAYLEQKMREEEMKKRNSLYDMHEMSHFSDYKRTPQELYIPGNEDPSFKKIAKDLKKGGSVTKWSRKTARRGRTM